MTNDARTGGPITPDRFVDIVLWTREVMDATALARLEELHARLARHKKHLILCGPHTQPYAVMERAEQHFATTHSAPLIGKCSPCDRQEPRQDGLFRNVVDASPGDRERFRDDVFGGG